MRAYSSVCGRAATLNAMSESTQPENLTESEYFTVTSPILQGTHIDPQGKERRFNIAELRPWEISFVDLKTLPFDQFQGYKYAVVLVDVKTLTIDISTASLIQIHNFRPQNSLLWIPNR